MSKMKHGSTRAKIINLLHRTYELSRYQLSDLMNLRYETIDYHIKKMLAIKIIKIRKTNQRGIKMVSLV